MDAKILVWMFLTSPYLLVAYSPEVKAENTFTGFNPNYVMFGADSETAGISSDENNVDIKFQISFISRIKSPLDKKIDVLDKLINKFGPFYFAYTQESYWDIGRDSLPFRESNYRPEFFFKRELSFRNTPVHSYLGFIHESNGRDGDASEGWDRLFYRFSFPVGNLVKTESNTSIENRLFVDAKIWFPFNDETERQPISNFAGYGQISLVYTPSTRWRFGGALRKGGGFTEYSHYLLQLDARYQANGSDIQWYAQYTNGYGASLERFDRHESSLRIGIMFFDFIFPQ